MMKDSSLKENTSEGKHLFIWADSASALKLLRGTGSKLMTTLLHELKRRKAERADLGSERGGCRDRGDLAIIIYIYIIVG